MGAEYATELGKRSARRSARELAVCAIGPLTVLAGLVWAVAQPYRITLLDPGDAGFWELLAQPPLLVIAVGLFFALVIAPGLLRDLEAVEAAERTERGAER
jgi:hypothetical protein